MASWAERRVSAWSSFWCHQDLNPGWCLPHLGYNTTMWAWLISSSIGTVEIVSGDLVWNLCHAHNVQCDNLTQKWYCSVEWCCWFVWLQMKSFSHLVPICICFFWYIDVYTGSKVHLSLLLQVSSINSFHVFRICYNVRSFASNVAMLSKFSLALYQWLPIPNKNLSGNEDTSWADILNVVFHVHETITSSFAVQNLVCYICPFVLSRCCFN